MTQKPEQTTPSPTWQEQFDYTFPTDNDGAIGHRHDGDCEWQCAKHRKIKQFIQTQIDQAYRQGFDYALGEIKSLECTNESHEKLKAEARAEMLEEVLHKVFPGKLGPGDPSIDPDGAEYKRGWDEALTQYYKNIQALESKQH